MIFLIDLVTLGKICFTLIFFIISIISPLKVEASHASDPSVLSLRNSISNNFTNKYCQAIENGFSKDEAMRSAIIKTENIVSFSLNPKKKFILKEDLANQVSIKVINKCGRSFGLIGKEGINYFKRYFLEINEKTTPNKKLSG